MFNVADCKIHWQKVGDYLCVKVDRYAKIKREKGDVKYSVRIHHTLCYVQIINLLNYYFFKLFHTLINVIYVVLGYVL